MGMVTAASLVLADPDTVAVRRLGIDEHRYRSVRFYREPDGPWRRFEPWMSTLVDADTGRVLGGGGRPGQRRDRPLARRAQPDLARADRGRRGRPVGGVPARPTRAAAARRGQRRPVPPGQARQRRRAAGAAAGHPQAQGPPRPPRGPGMGEPTPAAVTPSPQPAWHGSRRRSPP